MYDFSIKCAKLIINRIFMPVLPTTLNKLRIVCYTYNHSSYIEDAMNGFCMQKTNFPFVSIIIDDASTDGEPEIISQYLEDHFDMAHAQYDENNDAKRIAAIHKDNPNCHFLVILLKYNFYSIKKSKSPFYKGWYENVPYIAICEGDDYWTDPHKVQKQVDYLDTHPECGLVYTNAEILTPKSGELKVTDLPQQADFETLLSSSPIMTLTTCYRRNSIINYAKDIHIDSSWMMGDLPQWLYIASQCDIKYIPDVTGVYRVLEKSASHGNNIDKSVKFCMSSYKIRKFFVEKYNRQHFIKKICISHINELMNLAVSHNKNLSVVAAKMAIKDSVFSPKVWIKIMLYSTSFERIYHKRKYS